MKLRKYKNLKQAEYFLKLAREALKAVGAKKSLAKVRSALKSVGGAKRHMWRTMNHSV